MFNVNVCMCDMLSAILKEKNFNCTSFLTMFCLGI